MRRRHILGRFLLGLSVLVIGFCFWFNSAALPGSPGEARLIAFQSVPDADAESCEWDVATPQSPSYAPAAAAAVQRGDASSRLAVTSRPPDRFIQDPYPSFSSVAVDPARNEIVLTDENRFRIMVFDRLAVTPANAIGTEPKRVITGLHTRSQFASDLYIDPPSGDIYVINNDYGADKPGVFSRQAVGDIEPDREFLVMEGNFGLAVDEARQEVFFTEQRESAITVYKKSSTKKDFAVRLIQGDKTQLADPHGIAFDPKTRLLYVANYGTSHVVVKAPDRVKVTIPNWPGAAGGNEIVAGSGKFDRPSITVYSADIEGNAAPLRVIRGPKTGLDHPTGVALDVDRGELYVADEITSIVSVFSVNAQGDAAPLRTLKGPKTLMLSPSDVALDFVNNEMWVASLGNHLALAYKLGASGNTAPVRVIRGSPLNTPGSMISNPYALAYDSKRDEILVTSCVGHPRIAAFARTADKGALPVRAIEGSHTKTNRTMHGMAYDDIHDEIVVPSRIGQAVLTFRGGANGDEAPIRVIVGPKTGLRLFDKVTVDPVNNEILVYFGNQVVVFDRMAVGDVAPKRILKVDGLSANNAMVDPIHNLLIVSGGTKIWMFDRTAEGNATPRAVIGGGPISGLIVGNGMTVYPPTGAILVAARGEQAAPSSPEGLASDKAYVGVWTIDDKGDVPPRWTIAGPKGMLRQPRGLAVDARHKAFIVSDKYLNGVLTYSFPELFDMSRAQETARLAQP